jgi:NAD(P)-dependent dehydrogenase (short-subunit alcohol dehydrogenase family)
MAEDIAGKLVLITGAARGIGRALAREFHAAGCRLVLTDIDQEELGRAASELGGEKAEVFHRRVDVTDRDQVEGLAGWVLESFGPPDVLINNAGVGYQGSLALTGIDTWKRLLDINLMGPLYHIYAFLPSMKERRRGHIVNVSSGQAFFKLPAWGAYAAVKAALGVMSETLGYELRRYGIRVTTVYPFLVRTSFYDKIEARSFGARLSMKLLPYTADSPEKVARLIFRAVCRGKRVEKISIINELGRWAQMLPGLSQAISILADALLTEKE